MRTNFTKEFILQSEANCKDLIPEKSTLIKPPYRCAKSRHLNRRIIGEQICDYLLSMPRNRISLYKIIDEIY